MAVAGFQATLVQEAQRPPTGRWEGVAADENSDRNCEDNRTGSCRTRQGATESEEVPLRPKSRKIQVKGMVPP